MKHLSKVGLCLIALVHFSTVCIGHSETRLTLNQCLELARLHAQQILQGKLGEEKAKASSKEAVSHLFPRLFAEGLIQTSDEPNDQLPDDNKGVLRVEQNVLPFSADWTKGKQSASLQKAAHYSSLESVADVELTVKQLYFAILRDQKARQSYAEIEKELHKLQETLLPRYTVGRVPPFDFIKVKTLISDVERNRELIEAQLTGEIKQLAWITDFPQEAPWFLEDIKQLPELPETSAPFKTIKNATLLSLSEQVEASKWGLTSVKRSRWPSLLAGAEYGYSGQKIDTMSLGWGVSLGLTLPLWDWNEISSQVQQQQAEVNLAQIRLEIERQEINTEYEKTKALALAHWADEKRMNSLSKQVKEVAEVTMSRYRQGATGILEVSEAMNLWLETLLNEQISFYGYLSDVAKIERLTGNANIRYE